MHRIDFDTLGVVGRYGYFLSLVDRVGSHIHIIGVHLFDSRLVLAIYFEFGNFGRYPESESDGKGNRFGLAGFGKVVRYVGTRGGRIDRLENAPVFRDFKFYFGRESCLDIFRFPEIGLESE